MKLHKITVNKTAERPEGVDIHVVHPESDLESRLLSFMLPTMLREAERSGRLAFKLPERFLVDHRGEGTFVVRQTGGDSSFYEQPRPLAVLGIRSVGRRFDLVHAELKPRTAQERRSRRRQETAAEAEAGPQPEPQDQDPTPEEAAAQIEAQPGERPEGLGGAES